MDINHIHQDSNLNKLIKEYQSFYKEFYNGQDEISHVPAIRSIDHIGGFIRSNLNSDSRILEYGCATGFNLRYLKSVGYKNLHGIDALSKFIKIAESLSDDIDYTIANFGDGNSLSSLKLKYDFIFTRGVLQQYKKSDEIENKLDKSGDSVKHINNIVKAFNKLLDINGLVFIVEGCGLEKWDKIFEQNGFETFGKEDEGFHGDRFAYRKVKEN